MLRRHSPPATADQLTPAVPNRNIDPVTRLASNDEEFHLLPLGSIVRGRWKLVKRIGQGAFGQTFLAEDLLQLSSPPPSSSSSSSSSRSLARVAIKIEFSSALVRAPAKIVVPKKQVLRLEVAILKRLQGICPFVCQFIGCGKIGDGEDQSTFLVMQLLGDNLAELRKQRPNGKFSVATTALLLKQMLAATRCLHGVGYLHRDIKPSNFVMGTSKESSLSGRQRCYMVDFGLCRRYLSADGRVRQPRDRAGFRGTARYASINSHLNKELGRRDDLWSLFFVMVEFLRGSLPWRKEKDREKVGAMKLQITSPALVEGLPRPCLEFYRTIQSLDYADMPDYDKLERILDDLFRCSSQPVDVLYDWDVIEVHTKASTTGTNICANSDVNNDRLVVEEEPNHSLAAVAGDDSQSSGRDLAEQLRRAASLGGESLLGCEHRVPSMESLCALSNSQQANENSRHGNSASCPSLAPHPPSSGRSIDLPVFKSRLKRYRMPVLMK